MRVLTILFLIPQTQRWGTVEVTITGTGSYIGEIKSNFGYTACKTADTEA